jgi:hypothetical protein
VPAASQREKIDPRQVSARPCKAGDKAKPDWILPDQEDDGNRRGRRFGRHRRSSVSSSNDGYLTTNEIARQYRQSIVFALRPAVFDCYVVTLDITSFIQTPVERGNAVSVRCRVKIRPSASLSRAAPALRRR